MPFVQTKHLHIRLVFEKKSGGFFVSKKAIEKESKDYNALLYEKVQAEHDAFIEDLKTIPPAPCTLRSIGKPRSNCEYS